MRKNAWKQKVSKQATRAIFLAKYVLQKQFEEVETSSSINEADASNISNE